MGTSTSISTDAAQRMPADALLAAAQARRSDKVVAEESVRAAVAKPVEKKLPKADPEEARRNVEEVIHRLNEELKKNGRNLNFSMDQTVNRVVITVKNSHTGEVIRQIPDEAVMRVAHSIHDLKGLLLNKKV